MAKAIGSPTAFGTVPVGQVLFGFLALRLFRMILAWTPGRRGRLAIVADSHLEFFRHSPLILIDAVVVVGVHRRKGRIHLRIELRFAGVPLSTADCAAAVGVTDLETVRPVCCASRCTRKQ